MKTHDFIAFLICMGFVAFCLSVLIYGFAWLGKEYDVHDQIEDFRKEVYVLIEKKDKEVKDKFDQIMPAAFKGRK